MGITRKVAAGISSFAELTVGCDWSEVTMMMMTVLLPLKVTSALLGVRVEGGELPARPV